MELYYLGKVSSLFPISPGLHWGAFQQHFWVLFQRNEETSVYCVLLGALYTSKTIFFWTFSSSYQRDPSISDGPLASQECLLICWFWIPVTSTATLQYLTQSERSSLSLNSQMSKLRLVTSRATNNAARGRSYPHDAEELRDLKNISISTQI